MFQRVSVGLVAVALLLTVALLDALLAQRCTAWDLHPAFARGSLLPVALALIMAVASIELAALCRKAGYHPHTPWVVVVTLALVVSPWLCAGSLLGDGVADVEALPWQMMLVIVGVVGAVFLHVLRGQSKTSLGDAAATVLIIIYLGLLPSFAVLIRSNYDLLEPEEGIWILLGFLAIGFAADVGALAIGLTFGRHRLAPTISPKKSVEGFFGGILASVAVALLLAAISRSAGDSITAATDSFADRWTSLAFRSTILFHRLSLAQAIVFAIVISIVVQAGDLFESLLKRSAGVKDSSGFVPGMGGVLDVVDGVVLATPVAWLLLTRVWQVV